MGETAQTVRKLTAVNFLQGSGFEERKMGETAQTVRKLTAVNFLTLSPVTRRMVP
ncbi:hypothetical protein TRP8649_04606 [Pelagimonas phthalicica]|uniref:Uncharacterized protein n=2 Tax=Pelagimonas phthalicica TaxID=1037362 RepID=A0A238JKK7_9RHOB|nr:hypothetical protein TRP8649_04606 [Pelagimonas phthalicica]